ncbi:NAD kinase [hydrothermal vent metagenome]|uniref:NAD kinase n=1 Tax=hydrothermal vent metagenome TaxID=652676 RepID=A0A3B0W9F5_9ZZZZ
MKFNTIGIITKPQAETATKTLQSLFEFLKNKTCKVIVDKSIPDAINNFNFEKVSREEIGKQCDLAIVVGGDGTILNAVRSLSNANVPLLGINVGRLGFLADISPAELETSLNEILNGSYREEQRFLLTMQVIRDKKIIFEGDAFNDVVIHIRDVARMIEFETRINDEFVNHQRADGIVISTPTGSTAYALSAGGPLLHATLEAITLVPISPHTLSSRPLVVDAASQIDVLICDTKDGIAQTTCDGHLSTDVHVGDHIKVMRKAGNITLLHPKQHNYFEILRAKLHWSEHS